MLENKDKTARITGPCSRMGWREPACSAVLEDVRTQTDSNPTPVGEHGKWRTDWVEGVELGYRGVKCRELHLHLNEIRKSLWDLEQGVPDGMCAGINSRRSESTRTHWLGTWPSTIHLVRALKTHTWLLASLLR